MRTFSVTQRFECDLRAASRFLWNLDSLGAAWQGINRCQVLYDDGEHQESEMWIDRLGKEERIRIVRFREGEDITFFNPVPPPMMSLHRGSWRFAAEDASACRVEAAREYVLKEAHQVSQDGEAFHAAFQQRVASVLRACAQSLQADIALTSVGALNS